MLAGGSGFDIGPPTPELGDVLRARDGFGLDEEALGRSSRLQAGSSRCQAARDFRNESAETGGIKGPDLDRDRGRRSRPPPAAGQASADATQASA